LLVLTPERDQAESVTSTAPLQTVHPTRIAVAAPLLGPAAAGLSLFLIGTSAPVASTIRAVPLLTGQATRYLLAAALLVAALLITRKLPRVRPTRRDLLDIALLGAFGIAGFNLFLVSASYRVDPALVGTVLAATPLLLAVVSPALVRRRPAVRVVVGAAVVAAGTAFTTGVGAADPLGILFCLAALVCELAFTLLAVRLIARFGTFATTALASVSGAAVLLLAALVVDGPAVFGTVLAEPDQAVALLYLALAISIGANAAWYVALPRLGADRSGLFYAFSPVGALLASLLLGHGLPGSEGLIGLAVVGVGLLIGVWPQRTSECPAANRHR